MWLLNRGDCYHRFEFINTLNASHFFRVFRNIVTDWRHDTLLFHWIVTCSFKQVVSGRIYIVNLMTLTQLPKTTQARAWYFANSVTVLFLQGFNFLFYLRVRNRVNLISCEIFYFQKCSNMLRRSCEFWILQKYGKISRTQKNRTFASCFLNFLECHVFNEVICVSPFRITA